MLTTKQLTDIKELQNICENGEPFQLKLNWDMLEKREEDVINDFFHYVDEQLIGFIGIYGFGNKVELCGMVHPNYRRKGIFTQLLHHAEKVMTERGYEEILLNAPTKSNTAKEWLQTLSCTYVFSEYQMQWKEKELVNHEDVTLRTSTLDDTETEIQLDVQCFGFGEDGAREYNKQIKSESAEQNFIIETNGEKVGKMRVSHSDGEAWIYGFAIFPNYQGKGIGRKVLTNVILKEHEAGYPIFLEVEAKNANALRLYESCGFQAYHSQDYYKMV